MSFKDFLRCIRFVALLGLCIIIFPVLIVFLLGLAVTVTPEEEEGYFLDELGRR